MLKSGLLALLPVNSWVFILPVNLALHLTLMSTLTPLCLALHSTLQKIYFVLIESPLVTEVTDYNKKCGPNGMTIWIQ